MIRVQLPYHLRNLARVEGEALLDVERPVTPNSIVDAIEARFPMLKGTIRDAATGERRPFLRFFACGEDVSFQEADEPLPAAVAAGAEPFMVVGAIAGG